MDPSQLAPTRRRTVRVRTPEQRADHHQRVRGLIERNRFVFSDHPYLQAPYQPMTAPDLVGPGVSHLMVAVDVDDTVANFTDPLRMVLFNRNRGLELLFNALRLPLKTSHTKRDESTREDLLRLAFEDIYQGPDFDQMKVSECVFVRATYQFALELDAAGRPLDERSDPATLRDFLRVVLPAPTNYIYAKDERWGRFIVDHELQLAVIEEDVADPEASLPPEVQIRLRERHHDAIMASAAEEGFYLNMEWFDDSKPAMDEIANMGAILMFNTKCTHVSGLYEKIMADRIENILQQDVPFTGDTVFANMVSKHMYPFHIILEDAASNIKGALESGRGAVCKDYPHNRGGTWVGTDGVERLFEEHPLFRRVSTPAEFPAAVRQIAETLTEMYGEHLRLRDAPIVSTGIGKRAKLMGLGYADVGLDAKALLVGRQKASFKAQLLAHHEFVVRNDASELADSEGPELGISLS